MFNNKIAIIAIRFNFNYRHS